MIGKLFKHEVKRAGRWVVIFTLAAALIVGVGSLAGFFLPAPLNLLLGVLAAIVPFGYAALVQFWMGLEFYRSCYSKTGYLTVAYPVRGSTIFWVKAAFGYLAALVSMLVSLGLGALAMSAVMGAAGQDVGAFWAGTWALLPRLGALLPAWLWVLGAIMILLMPLACIAPYYFAAAVGSEAWINRLGLGGPVLVWFMYYVGNQIVTAAGLFLPLNVLFDGGKAAVSTDPLVVFKLAEDQPLLPMGALLLSMLCGVVALWWAKVSYDRRLELR